MAFAVPSPLRTTPVSKTRELSCARWSCFHPPSEPVFEPMFHPDSCATSESRWYRFSSPSKLPRAAVLPSSANGSGVSNLARDWPPACSPTVSQGVPSKAFGFTTDQHLANAALFGGLRVKGQVRCNHPDFLGPAHCANGGVALRATHDRSTPPPRGMADDMLPGHAFCAVVNCGRKERRLPVGLGVMRFLQC